MTEKQRIASERRVGKGASRRAAAGAGAVVLRGSPLRAERLRMTGHKHAALRPEYVVSARTIERRLDLRRHFCLFSGNAGDGGGEIIRRLRAADREAGIENESRYALDARVLGGIGFALDGFDIVIAAKPPPDQIAVQAAILRGLDQNFAIAEVGALREVEVHQPLLDARRIGGTARPADQAMTIARVGLAADLVGRIDEPFRRRR